MKKVKLENVVLKTETVTTEKGTTVYLKDDRGYIVGTYNDEATALKAAPIIKYNLEVGSIPAWALPKRRPQKPKQVSKR